MPDNEDEHEEIEGLRILGPDPDQPQEDHGLPHWTEPGTGEVPRLSDEGEDLAAWSALETSEPRWADDVEDEEFDLDYAEDDEYDPVAISSAEDDFFTYGYEDGEELVDDTELEPAAAAGAARAGRVGLRPTGGDRNLPEALLSAGLLSAVAILCLWLGKGPTLVLITVVLAAASMEFYVTLRRVGYQPATLLGIAAVGALPLAAYWRFEAGIPVVLFLTMLFLGVWYLLGVNTERPVPNLGVTLLGVVYIGVLGSFAALIIRPEHGRALLVCAILVTVGYDVGAFFVGRALGSASLSAASPNKTIEGLIGGMVVAAAVGLVIGILGIDPFDDPTGTVGDALIVGIVAAIVAPIGDLTESLMKRDLNIKDMGTILPGHGGILDRFDALLFVLPAVYYVTRVLDVI